MLVSFIGDLASPDRHDRPGVFVRTGPGVPLALLKKDRVSVPTIIAVPGTDEREAFERVRCPLCGWQPSASSRWCCDCRGTPEPAFEACGTVWNTFSTGGRCPGCDHQWQWTSCHRCGEFSLHIDWYDTSG